MAKLFIHIVLESPLCSSSNSRGEGKGSSFSVCLKHHTNLPAKEIILLQSKEEWQNLVKSSTTPDFPPNFRVWVSVWQAYCQWANSPCSPLNLQRQLFISVAATQLPCWMIIWNRVNKDFKAYAHNICNRKILNFMGFLECAPFKHKI